MPDEYPEYPHHSQMLEYLRAYAAHFGVDRRIEYRTPVERIEPASDNDWIVTLARGEKRRYGAVVVANGHNWDPKYPNLPGEFHGQAFHSASYRTPDLFTGKRVLVIGAGNSGCDIAVDAVKAGARRVFHSMRRGYHILPKFIMGRPVDQIYSQMLKLHLPLAVRRMAAKLAIWLVQGSNRNAGLPEPDHRLFETHPLVNQLLPYFVLHGSIEPKPDVTGLEGDAVRFSDGSRKKVDVLVYATGYRHTFPFLDSTLLNWENGRPGLHLNLFHPEYDTLFVAGLIQPNSGEIFLLHWQSRAIALFLRALECGAPAADWLRERKRKMEAELSSGIRYSESPRHSLEVEQGSYYRELKQVVKELEKDLEAEDHKVQKELAMDSGLLSGYRSKFRKKLSSLT